MKNKVLISVYVPKLLSTYEVYIPVNERIMRIKELLIKAVYDLSDSSFSLIDNHFLIDGSNGTILKNNDIVRNTSIKNVSNLILF